MVTKALLPKVLRNISQYKPKIAAPTGKGSTTKLDLEKAKIVKSGSTYYSVFDEAELPIKDFKSEKAARDFLRKDPLADSYKVGKTGTQPPVEDTGALYFASRDAIIQAPQEKMGANQWLSYLKSRNIKSSEMRDTSLGNFLANAGGKSFTKGDLVKEFDEIAPQFDVVALGTPGPESILNSLYKNVRKIDPETKDPRVGGLVSYLQNSLPTVIQDGKLAQGNLDKIVTNVNKYMERTFGIKGAMEQGLDFSVNVPFAIREPLSALSSAVGSRGINLTKKDYALKPAHAGQQTLPGGDNYREFMFKYKPGKLRQNEPTYDYAHSFNLAKPQRENAFVHTRVSDRTDEFGRRILFVEEIQSDMHQPIQRAIRESKAAGKKVGDRDGYARREDLPLPPDLAANKQQLDLINLKIENLLATNPRSPALKKLGEERGKIRQMLQESKDAAGNIGGSVPEGPFQNSQEYMEFVAKYLVRIAKDGKYDGVAFANPRIKNRSLTPGGRDFNGNLGAYGPILNKALSNASKKTGANLLNTVIRTPEGEIFGGVKMLNLKGNNKAEEIISGGISAFQEGGVVHGR